MISRIKNKLVRDGAINTALALYDFLVPLRIPDYSNHYKKFSGKTGIEIGGPSKRFGRRGYLDCYKAAGRMDNCNYTDKNIWGVEYDEHAPFYFYPGRDPGKQYVCEGQDLKGVGDDMYDFLLSSHCLEHIANPLKALYEWKRVLKPGGRLFLILPHRDCTFDKHRPVTDLDHMISDYENNIEEDDLTHLDEILDLHFFQPNEVTRTKAEFEEIARDNHLYRTLHHHVFDTATSVRLVEHSGFAVESAYSLRPHDIVIIGRKPLNTSDTVESLSSENLAKILNKSPFKTDLSQAKAMV